MEMQLLRDLQHLPQNLYHGAVSIGNFDGVHLGHARLIERLVKAAKSCGGPAVVLTFDPSPLSLLRPDVAPPKLTTVERRAELLKRLGVDWVIAYPTDRTTLQLTAEQFFQSILVDSLHARAVVEGENFFFGKDRQGNVEKLSQLCAANRMQFEQVTLAAVAEQVVSSSRIRELLLNGDIENANRALTSPYVLSGSVVTGAQRGRLLGFPTANLAGIETLIPATGVYAAIARLGGERYRAAVHIGPNPTYGESNLKVEVHLIAFEGDLYGKQLEVEFHFKIRDVVRFADIEALRTQLLQDIAQARRTVPL